MDSQVNVQPQESQQLLFFVTLLSSGACWSSWEAESWTLLLNDWFKTECCCPPVVCLTPGVSLLGVILNQAGRTDSEMISY